MSKLRYSRRLFGEFVAFARENKAWWIVPLAVFLAITAVAIIGGGAAGPLIYALF